MASLALPTTLLPAFPGSNQFIEAGEAIPAGRFIRRGSDGKAYKASNSGQAVASVIGVAQTTANAAGQQLAYWGPGVELVVTGLSKGVSYYLDHGTNEVQTLTITGTPTGGTFKLSFMGQVTASLAYNAASATVQSALEALSTVGAGNVTVSGSAGGPYTVTFVKALGGQPVSALVLDTNAFTGGTAPTMSIVETTPGTGAGQTCVFADVVSGEFYTFVGVAKSATSFLFNPIMTGASA